MHKTISGQDVRLDGFADSVQHVLNLARLLPDRVEGAGLCAIVILPSEGIAGAEAVALRRSSQLRHRNVIGEGGCLRGTGQTCWREKAEN